MFLCKTMPLWRRGWWECCSWPVPRCMCRYSPTWSSTWCANCRMSPILIRWVIHTLNREIFLQFNSSTYTKIIYLQNMLNIFQNIYRSLCEKITYQLTTIVAFALIFLKNTQKWLEWCRWRESIYIRQELFCQNGNF